LSSNDLFALEIKKLNERFDEFIKWITSYQTF
jgi:hypothetical protein